MPDRTAPDYILGHSDDELGRLARQGAFLAGQTRDLLRRAGLGAGMRVLDIGCGVGDVALLAAEIVGPSGRVVGIDRSPAAVATAQRRADAAGLRSIELVAGDIDHFSGAAPFDALIGRLVLLYMADPAATLRRLAGCLRPGAIVAFQEMDMATGRSAPDAPLYQRCGALVARTFAAAGFETAMGSKLHGLFRRAGLPAPQLFGTSRVEAGPDSPVHEYLAQTIRSLLPVIERFGLATAAEIGIDTLADRLRAESLSGDHCHIVPLMIGAWTRLPG